ncbi:MAG: hypothetical protein D3924_18190 [Candidatus Electrothrix sp. AR4]|nr:hypothetical protein [Candidatus Electrothrix sp. AR4]
MEAELVDAHAQTEQLTIEQEKTAGLEAQIVTLQAGADQLAVIQEQVTILEKKLAEAHTQEEQLGVEQEKTALLEAQLSEMKEKAKELAVVQEKVAALEGELTEVLGKAEELTETVEKRDALAAELAKTQGKLQEQDTAIAKLTTAFDEKEAESLQIQEAQAETAAKNAILAGEIKKLKNTLQEKNLELEKNSKVLGQTNSRLQEQAAAVTTLEELRKTSEKLVRKLEAGNTEKATLQQKIIELQAEIDRLNAQLAQQTAQQIAQETIEESTTADQTDSDQDGVLDARDLCADTPTGTTVDAMGCADSSSIVLSGVNFTVGTAKLTKKAETNLKTTAILLQEYAPDQRFEVAGYTDTMGSPQRNQKISEQRANTVRTFLIKQGVKGELLISKGYGQENPIGDNGTPEGRARNRRVELHQYDAE